MSDDGRDAFPQVDVVDNSVNDKLWITRVVDNFADEDTRAVVLPLIDKEGHFSDTMYVGSVVFITAALVGFMFYVLNLYTSVFELVK